MESADKNYQFSPHSAADPLKEQKESKKVCQSTSMKVLFSSVGLPSPGINQNRKFPLFISVIKIKFLQAHFDLSETHSVICPSYGTEWHLCTPSKPLFTLPVSIASFSISRCPFCSSTDFFCFFSWALICLDDDMVLLELKLEQENSYKGLSFYSLSSFTLTMVHLHWTMLQNPLKVSQLALFLLLPPIHH